MHVVNVLQQSWTQVSQQGWEHSLHRGPKCRYWFGVLPELACDELACENLACDDLACNNLAAYDDLARDDLACYDLVCDAPWWCIMYRYCLQTPCVKLHTFQYLTPLQINKDRSKDMTYLHAQSTTCQGKKPSATHTLDPSSQGFQQPDIGFLWCMDNPATWIGLSAAQHRVSRVHDQPFNSYRIVSSPI